MKSALAGNEISVRKEKSDSKKQPDETDLPLAKDSTMSVALNGGIASQATPHRCTISPMAHASLGTHIAQGSEMDTAGPKVMQVTKGKAPTNPHAHDATIR